MSRYDDLSPRAPFRMTTTTRLVLAALRGTDHPIWGLEVCRMTGLGSGTVYPILKRLHGHGWVETWLEAQPHPGRPQRRLYRLVDQKQKQEA